MYRPFGGYIRSGMHADQHFIGNPGSIAAARQFVKRIFGEWGLPDHEAVLLVSELATNAVVHAHTDYQVDVTRTDGVVRVAVTDGNPTAPEAVEPPVSHDAPGGRGLWLVVRLARRWGYELDGASKTVWFEL
ncbi:MAG: ATP-binding protein [Acidimicrobiales bacterium]